MGGEEAPDAVVDADDKLMAQILQRIERPVDRRRRLVVLMDIGIADAHLLHRTACHQVGRAQRGIQGRSHVVQQADVQRVILHRVLRLVHPVDHVRAMGVEGIDHDVDAHAPIARAYAHLVLLLRLEIDISLLGHIAGIEIGVGGQAQRLVVRGVHLPVIIGPVAHVDAGIEAIVAVETRVAVGHHAGRQREAAHDDIMLQEEARVRPSATMVIKALAVPDLLHVGRVEGRAVGRGVDVLLTDVEAYGRPARQPLQVGVDATAIHQQVVIVLAVGRAVLAADELIVVIIPVAIQLGRHLPPVLPVVEGQAGRRHEIVGLLILVIVIGAVERVGTVALLIAAGLHRQIGQCAQPQPALDEDVAALEVAVVRASVRAVIASADKDGAVGQHPGRRIRAGIGRALGTEGTEGAALHTGREAAAGNARPRHDVDRTVEGRRAQDARAGTPEHLYALDIAQGDREEARVVARLRIGDIHAVEQNRDLVKGAAIDGDIRLYAKTTALTDIDTGS